jgi:hypothetical protein
MNYTAGPWAVVSTVSNDRKNLFGTAPYREYHIGTFISGSRRDVDILKSNVALMAYAPNMYEALKSLDILLSEKDLTRQEAKALRECRSLLKRIQAEARK